MTKQLTDAVPRTPAESLAYGKLLDQAGARQGCMGTNWTKSLVANLHG